MLDRLAVLFAAVAVSVGLLFAVSTTDVAVEDAQAHAAYTCSHYDGYVWSQRHFTHMDFIRHYNIGGPSGYSEHKHRYDASHRKRDGGVFRMTVIFDC